VTQPTAFHDRAARRRPAKRWWVAGNLILLAVVAAVSSPGLAVTEDIPSVLSFLMAFSLFGPFRAVAVLIEYYLVGQYADRSIIVSHFIALVFSSIVFLSPATGAGPAELSGVPLAVFSWLMFALAALVVAFIAAVIRARRRGGPPQPRPRRPLRSLPALFWLNAIFIIVVGVLLGPAMTGPQGGSAAVGVVGGVLFAAMLRAPGVWAEWLLVKRAPRWTILVVHGIAAALAVAILVTPPVDPAAEPMGLGDGVGIYVMLGSIFGWPAVAITVLAAITRRRSARRAGEAIPAELPAPHPPHDEPPTIIIERAATVRATAPVQPSPVLVPSVAAAPSHDQEPVRAPAQTDRTSRLRQAAMTNIGFAVGLASLVQGYSGEEWLRTVVLALLIGAGGLAAVWHFSKAG
jgi:hypothetical protein